MNKTTTQIVFLQQKHPDCNNYKSLVRTINYITSKEKQQTTKDSPNNSDSTVNLENRNNPIYDNIPEQEKTHFITLKMNFIIRILRI